MIVILGILSFAILSSAGYDMSVKVCAIIGAILAIPGGIIGMAIDGILGFSVTGLLNARVSEIMSTALGRFVINAIRTFFLPFIVLTVFYMIIA